MAKKRRVKSRSHRSRSAQPNHPAGSGSTSGSTSGSGASAGARTGLQSNASLEKGHSFGATHGTPHSRVEPWSIALGLLGGTIVYVVCYPSDSVLVERGDALWFCFLGIVIATVTMGRSVLSGVATRRDAQDQALTGQDAPKAAWTLSTRLLDWAPWVLAAWMMVAAFASSPPGNLRMATNEAWLWVSGAAVFVASRRLLASLYARQAVLLLLIVCGIGLAVHGMHQTLISLPENRAQYQQDPERILALAGIDAPAGSAQRMVFENRLFDGGPTGTFALANSLAAVLLLGVVATLGVLRLQWPSAAWSTRCLWCSALVPLAVCLIATRSRSAIVAALLGITLVFIGASRVRRSRSIVALAGIAGLAIVFALGLAVFGNPEWFEEAPTSLAFRFQYWRATWQLAIDRPWFGAGPGNFQSIYERYREASATEQVAEPHNFIFETLASGGFVALAILMALIIGVIGSINAAFSSADSARPGSADPASRWLWLGSGLGLVLVWVIGTATRVEPDVHAHLFAVPTGIVFAILLWPHVGRLAGREIDMIAAIGLLVLMVHLSVAGGWTVPGVAVMVWLLGAMLTRTEIDPSSSQATRWKCSMGWILSGSLGLTAIYWMSVKPVAVCAREMASAEHAQVSGQISRSKTFLLDAMSADPWSPDATLWMADFHRWQLVYGEDSRNIRQNWESALREARRRAGDDPAIYRTIGAQQLHLYQRYGQRRDLDAAAQTFQLAAQWSPSHQWIAAQVAVIADARGQDRLASSMARRALELSTLGGNIERALRRQQVYVPIVMGQSAIGGPVRRSAEELLSNHFDSGDVDADE